MVHVILNAIVGIALFLTVLKCVFLYDDAKFYREHCKQWKDLAEATMKANVELLKYFEDDSR